MASPRDPLKAFTLPGRKTPLRSGGGSRKSSESPADFLARVQEKRPRRPEPLPVLITAVEGDTALAALYYGESEDFIKDVLAVHKPSKDAMVKARAVAHARQKEGNSLADAMKKEQLDAVARLPDMPRRERWPADDTERRRAIRDWLIDDDVLVLYEGDLVRISDAGTIPMHQLVGLLDGDEELERLRDLGLRIRAERAASRMMELSERSNQPTATDKILKAFGDDRWKDKSQVDVRRVGFEPPAASERSDDGELVSVLRRVK